MDNVLNLTPTPMQLMFAALLQIWLYVIFPVLILRKLNYMRDLLEGLYDENEPEPDSGNDESRPQN
jgi:hypothetical protein